MVQDQNTGVHLLHKIRTQLTHARHTLRLDLSLPSALPTSVMKRILSPFKAARLASGLLAVCALALTLCSPLHAREVVLSTTAWVPYIGLGLPGQGYVAEVAREALARSGHSLRLVFLPWARAVHMARQGKFDGYLPEYDSPEMQREFLFSAPFPGGPLGFFKRRTTPMLQSLELDDLKPYRIGVVRGYVNTPQFDARTDLNKHYANDDEANLRMLLAGRIDLMLTDMYVGWRLARRHSPEAAADIEFVQPPLARKDLHVCFTARLPQAETLRRQFDAGLRQLAREGTLARLRAKHGLY